MTRARRILLAVAVLAAALTTAAGPGGATAAAQSPTDGAPVELLGQSTWVTPDGDVTLRLDVAGADPADTVRVTFHGRLTSRGAFTQSLAGDGVGRVVRTIAAGTVAELDADADGRVDVALGLRSGAGDQQRLLVTREGVYPIVVTHEPAADDEGRSGEDTSFVTHVVRLPATVETTLGLAVVQSLTAPPSTQPDGTVTIDPDAAAALTGAATTFGAGTPVPVTFTVTGETAAALTATGDPQYLQLLTDLQTALATGELAASPYVRIDPEALRFGALNDEVAAQIERGAEAAVQHLDARPDSRSWIADPGLGATGLSALADAGVERTVVADTELVGDRPDLLVQPFDLLTDDGRRIRALATDRDLQAHAGRSGSGVLDAQHLLADLASIWFERPAYSRATAVRLPTGMPDRAFVDTLLRGLAASPLLRVGGIDEVIAGADPAAVGDVDAQVEGPDDRLTLGLVGPTERPELSGYAAQRQRTVDQVESFAGIFEGSPQVDSYMARIAVSASADLDAPTRSRYLSAIRDDIDLRTANIGMPDRGAITLPSRDGVIPLTLVNNTGSPVSVVIQMASDKLEFPEGDRVELTLTEPSTPIEVPVRARASGAFPLDMSLESPDGRIQLVDSRYTVRSTAVSGLGVALSIAAVVVLGAWWIRTARRARAAHRAVDGTPQ